LCFCLFSLFFGLSHFKCFLFFCSGVVVSTKFNEDIVSVWHRTASDRNTTYRIR
jgi:hypothetical protein